MPRTCELCGGNMTRDRRYTRRNIFICRNHAKPVTVEDPGYEAEDERKLQEMCLLEGCERPLKQPVTGRPREYCSDNHGLRARRQRHHSALGREGMPS